MLKCLRCGNEWEPDDPEKKPKACPKCKNYSWDKPAREKKGHNNINKKRAVALE